MTNLILVSAMGPKGPSTTVMNGLTGRPIVIVIPVLPWPSPGPFPCVSPCASPCPCASLCPNSCPGPCASPCV